MSCKIYEYRVREVIIPNAAEDSLNAMSNEGWEVFNVNTYVFDDCETAFMSIVFRRVKKAPDDE